MKSAIGAFGWDRDGVGGRIQVRDDESSGVPTWLSDVETRAPLAGEGMYVESAFPVRRFIVAGVGVALLLSGLGAKAAWMQVGQGDDFAALADRNRLRRQVLVPQRGIIRDRRGVVLAENTPAFDVVVHADLLPEPGPGRDDVLAVVSRELGTGLSDLQANVPADGGDGVLARDIPHAMAARLEIAARHPAISIRTGQKRRYPKSAGIPSLSHILGYVGPVDQAALDGGDYQRTDVVGRAGLEATYEALLRGVPGYRDDEVDAMQRRTVVQAEQPAIDGRDVVLSLDAGLQQAAEHALREGIATSKAKRGSAIAMDPRDGSVLALVSWPAYDNNFFSGNVSSTYYKALVDDPERPLFPRAWGGQFPSGSTIKPVFALAALAEGIVTPRTSVLSTGGIRVGAVFFPDWKAGGHGATNVRSAIAWSVNTFFYYIGGGYEGFTGMGAEKLARWMEAFGFGRKSGIDIPGETAGSVPEPKTREAQGRGRWYIGDTYNMSIGQGDILVTPLQVAAMTAQVANGGTSVRPHVGPYRFSSKAEAVPETVPAIFSRAKPEMFREVQAGMRDGVKIGSSRAMSGLPFPVAGKTGTAQWSSKAPNHAWWTGFAPAEAPEIVVTVLIEEGGEGSSAAVPVAKRILEAWKAMPSFAPASP